MKNKFIKYSLTAKTDSIDKKLVNLLISTCSEIIFNKKSSDIDEFFVNTESKHIIEGLDFLVQKGALIAKAI